jgi:hypothetical protein
MQSQTIGRLWATERAEFISKLKSRNIGTNTLVGTDYHLNLMVGESNLTRLQDPTALFEFTTTTPGGEQVICI